MNKVQVNFQKSQSETNNDKKNILLFNFVAIVFLGALSLFAVPVMF